MDDDLEQELRMEERRRMIYNNDEDEEEEVDDRRFLDVEEVKGKLHMWIKQD